MSGFKKLNLFLVLCGMAWLLSASNAGAGFVATHTGNTQMSDNPLADGIVNFAVFDNTAGGSWATAVGLAAGDVHFDTGSAPTARFVYFYQVVNIPSVGDENLSQLRVPTNGIPYSSAGWLPGRVFNERVTLGPVVDSPVGPTGNRYLGTEAASETTGKADAPPFTPSETGVLSTDAVTLGLVSGTPFVTHGSALNPTEADANGSPEALFQWRRADFPGGVFSSVVFLTSEIEPYVGFGNGRIVDGGPDIDSDGGIPVHAPAPAGALLMLFGLGGSYAWRRFRKPAPTV